MCDDADEVIAMDATTREAVEALSAASDAEVAVSALSDCQRERLREMLGGTIRDADPMRAGFERDVTMARIRMAFKLTTAAILAVVLAFLLFGCSYDAGGNPNKTPGLPLDAHSVTEYNKPEWLRYCDHCYKVTDRNTGQSWWLLVMREGTGNEDYIALPILGGGE